MGLYSQGKDGKQCWKLKNALATKPQWIKLKTLCFINNTAWEKKHQRDWGKSEKPSMDSRERACVSNCCHTLVDVAPLLESFSCCSSFCCSLTSSQVDQTQPAHLLPTRLQRRKRDWAYFFPTAVDPWHVFLLETIWCNKAAFCSPWRKTNGPLYTDYFHLSTRCYYKRGSFFITYITYGMCVIPSNNGRNDAINATATRAISFCLVAECIGFPHGRKQPLRPVPYIVTRSAKTLTAHETTQRHYITESATWFSAALNWALLWFASTTEIDDPEINNKVFLSIKMLCKPLVSHFSVSCWHVLSISCHGLLKREITSPAAVWQMHSWPSVTGQ